MQKTKYAIVGTGHRSYLYIDAIVRDFPDVAQLVAFCDTNQTRMDVANRHIKESFGATELPTYRHDRFAEMISEQRPDKIIVASIDATHHYYIQAAMENGCDVITEKPMTIDAEKCQTVVDTIERTHRDLRVVFNARYAPRNTKVKEVLQSGAIGQVLSVHFEWLLDTIHGADYFRRWHRDKANSGGLLVHKSTHHFDLINWWIDSRPETVFAFGRLAFYGRENAKARGVKKFYERARGSDAAHNDPFALHLEENEQYRRMYLDAEHEDGYFRDQSVFGEGITTEDTVSLAVRYHNKATMSYSLNAHCPWEGYRVMFNGTKGRLEFEVVDRPYDRRPDASDGDPAAQEDVRSSTRITVQNHWEKQVEIAVEGDTSGQHAGSDVRLLADLFRGVGDDPYHHAANYRDGAYSILTGIAANRSIESGQPVDVDSLVRL